MKDLIRQKVDHTMHHMVPSVEPGTVFIHSMPITPSELSLATLFAFIFCLPSLSLLRSLAELYHVRFIPVAERVAQPAAAAGAGAGAGQSSVPPFVVNRLLTWF